MLIGVAPLSNIDYHTSETLLIRGKSRTIRRIQSIHYLDRKDPALHPFIL